MYERFASKEANFTVNKYTFAFNYKTECFLDARKIVSNTMEIEPHRFLLDPGEKSVGLEHAKPRNDFFSDRRPGADRSIMIESPVVLVPGRGAFLGHRSSSLGPVRGGLLN